ncbi:MAG TPA: PASTA domain-containing protein [Micromonosporaceae bacterium]|nr:PASTA domain-containing protein [Micromonosporaceae bacterium]
MANNEEWPDRPGREGAPRGDEVDQTKAFDPLADDHPEGGPAGRSRPDETTRFETGAGADETARFAPGGAVPPDRTAAMPPTGRGPQPGEPPAWSGRASVPPPGPPMRESVPAEWGPGEEPPSRTWWLPILIGIVALLLLAVLGYGLWLIANSRDGEVPVTPSPSPSAAPTPTVQTPTSAAPTTESPSPSPTTPESVAVPPVVNLPQPMAETLLEQFGLRYRIEYRESNRPAGTVLDSDPEPGAEVAPGTEVTLIVAEQRKEPRTKPPATDAPGPTSTG